MTQISPRVYPALVGLLLIVGCQNQSSKQKDDGKTYVPAQKGSAAQTQNGEQPNKPLNSPAETVNGMASPESDTGGSQALKGQAVAQPGAPVEHQAAPASKAQPQAAPNPR